MRHRIRENKLKFQFFSLTICDLGLSSKPKIFFSKITRVLTLNEIIYREQKAQDM